MRILHTSDWHLGRTFHGERVLDALRGVLEALVAAVAERGVDVVVVAGDVFDSTTPAAEAFELLDDLLVGLAEAGARVVVTSGNHDSAARLRFQSRFARLGGVHVLADHAHPESFVDLDDAHGPVRFHGIPYLEPALVRRFDGAAEVRSQHDAVAWAMDRIRALGDDGPARRVIAAHCFAAGVPDAAMADDLERDLTAGGLDVVPIGLFEGADYVALGHIHGRAVLAESVRYSGAPLHYSFGEAGAPRGAWLVDLDADGFAGAEWLELPVPRPLRVLRGRLDELLADPALADAAEAWVAARLTDTDRPTDAMRRLRSRFPHALHLEFAPIVREGAHDYRARLAAATTPEERVDAFLAHVRGGEGLRPLERSALRAALDERLVEEAAR